MKTFDGKKLVGKRMKKGIYGSKRADFAFTLSYKL